MSAMPSDVATVLQRPLEELEGQLAEVLLAVVVERISARAIASGKVYADLDNLSLIYAEASAVARVLRNPEGYRSEQDNAYGYALDSRVASGRLSVLDDEWADLGLGGKAFTVNVVPPARYPRFI